MPPRPLHEVKRIVTPAVPTPRAPTVKPAALKPQVLQSGRAPAQLSLFLRPTGAP
jgi:hypothetical protein